MPWRNFKNPLNHSSLALPKSSMSLKLSPAQSRQHTAMINTSIKSCSLVRSIRGSARSLKCSMRLSLGCVCIPFHLNTFSKSTSAKMAHPQLSFQRFLDASALDFILANGVRKAINAYLEERTFNFVFDPDHAMVAYPLQALGLVGNQLVTGGFIGVDVSEQEFLKSGAKDKTGGLSVLLAEMRRLGLVP